MHKILVIEDSNLVRIKTIKTLERYGYITVGINSANLLIDKPYVYLNEIELIIMDIGLPGISGIEAAYWLKTNNNYAMIPVIFLSGLSDSVTVKKALQAGGVDYIVKPFEETDLIKRVEKLLKHKNLITDNFPIIEMDKIKEIISIEYSRAIRGKQPVSFILFKAIKNQTINIIKEKLRIIDQIYILKNEETLIILPLTDHNGAEIVVKKIKNWLNEEELTISKIVNYTIIADESKTLEELISNILDYSS